MFYNNYKNNNYNDDKFYLTNSYYYFELTVDNYVSVTDGTKHHWTMLLNLDNSQSLII